MSARTPHDGPTARSELAGDDDAEVDYEEAAPEEEELAAYEVEEKDDRGAREKGGSAVKGKSSRSAKDSQGQQQDASVLRNYKKAAYSSGSHTNPRVVHGTGALDAPFRGGSADAGGRPSAGLLDGSLEVSPSVEASGSNGTVSASWTHAMNSKRFYR